MESSPLTQAHRHARNALNETHKSNPVAASEEHDLAAGEFAHAAQTTGDPEALRTLKLLEEHHKKLAQILKFRNEHPPIPKASETPAPLSPQQPSETPPPTKAPIVNVEPAHQPPRLPPQSRPPHRDLTSSIASNLASARGIPANQQRRGSPASPTLSAQQAGGRMHSGAQRSTIGETKARKDSLLGSTSENPRQTSLSRSNIPPPIVPPPQDSHSTANSQSRTSTQSSINDEPFQRFYSTFEGLISKLSAPLAFAGLPLTGPTNAPESKSAPATPRKSKSPLVPSNSATNANQEPDLNKLISRAALRAVKDTNSPGNFSYNAAESFYVVPTTGGTISYAGILSRAEQESLRQHRSHSNPDPGKPTPFFKELQSTDDDETASADGDFVDARETPPQQSPAPVQTRHGRSRSGGAPTVGGKTMEELHLENQALKHLSDTLSKRLHMWEVNAQSSSAALHQSLRAMQHAPTSPRAMAMDSKVPAQGGDAERLQELEELIKKADLEKERVERENEKLKLVVGRYRERWEKLKEGARVRREGNGSGGGSAGREPEGET